MMKTIAGLATAVVLASSCVSGGMAAVSASQEETPAVRAKLAAISSEVSKARLRGYIEKMISFGTRHTLSDQVSDTRGIGTARRWVEAEFRKMSGDCGGCLEVVTVQDTVTAPPRVPSPTVVANAVAIQRGATDPNRIIIIQGHLDSRTAFEADFPFRGIATRQDGNSMTARFCRHIHILVTSDSMIRRGRMPCLRLVSRRGLPDLDFKLEFDAELFRHF